MSSPLAMWAYHRRLSMEAQRVKESPDPEPQNITDRLGNRKRAVRHDSESSIPPEDRRVSIDPEESDDEDHDHEKRTQIKQGKPRRRFSMDFLFGKRGHKKSKKIRSKSMSEQSDQQEGEHIREYKYPGVYSTDFSMMYFI